MSNIILSAQSSSNEVKEYFNSVLTLTKSGEKFPVDLDDVWPLCYAQKVKAVQLLTDSGQFYEGEDYVLLSQKVKQTEVGSGGHNRQVYMLSVPCMEYLIARKVRTVFEVYRRVFHEFLNMKRMSSDEAIAYGYGKALEKINRQSTIIARQSKQLQKYKLQLESKKEAKRERMLLDSETRHERITDKVREMFDANPITQCTSLCDLHRQFILLFASNEEFDISNKMLSSVLRNMGYRAVRKSQGMYFKPCHEN